MYFYKQRHFYDNTLVYLFKLLLVVNVTQLIPVIQSFYEVLVFAPAQVFQIIKFLYRYFGTFRVDPIYFP